MSSISVTVIEFCAGTSCRQLKLLFEKMFSITLSFYVYIKQNILKQMVVKHNFVPLQCAGGEEQMNCAPDVLTFLAEVKNSSTMTRNADCLSVNTSLLNSDLTAFQLRCNSKVNIICPTLPVGPYRFPPSAVFPTSHIHFLHLGTSHLSSAVVTQ